MLSENLAMLRSLKGLSQEQAAEIAGVARQSYAKWEQGDTLPDDFICPLCKHGAADFEPIG